MRAAKGKVPIIDEKDDDTVAGSLPASKDSAAVVLGMPEEMIGLPRSVEGMDEVLEDTIMRS